MNDVGILLENPKTPYNVGSVIRGMAVFEGTKLRWTGERVIDPRSIARVSVVLPKSAHYRMPREERMKDWQHIDWASVDASRPLDEFEDFIPVCVEVLSIAESLVDFIHPERAVYVFGPEDGGVSKGMRAACHRFVSIPSRHCLNLACAVNIVLYDRVAKLMRASEVAPWSVRQAAC
jgi:tRNA(Leu) C34 or U34 (ribose-2'-O)-methylase TrmL